MQRTELIIIQSMSTSKTLFGVFNFVSVYVLEVLFIAYFKLAFFNMYVQSTMDLIHNS